MRTRDVSPCSFLRCFTSNRKLPKTHLPTLLTQSSSPFTFNLLITPNTKEGISNNPILRPSDSIGIESHKKGTLGISLYTSSQHWMLQELTVDCVAGFVILYWYPSYSSPSWLNLAFSLYTSIYFQSLQRCTCTANAYMLLNISWSRWPFIATSRL